jgi:oligopeptide transport system substrate-binding protein
VSRPPHDRAGLSQPALRSHGWRLLTFLVIGGLLLTAISCSPAGPGDEPASPAVPLPGEDGGEESTAGGPREVRPLSRSEDPVTLDWSLETDPASLDPALVTDRASLDCTANLFVGLTRYDPDTSAVLPYLATSWEVSEDGMTYTFYLRGDIQWVKYDQATGSIALQRPVDAHDVEYSIKRAIDPATESHYAYVFYVIQNAPLVHSGAPELTLDDVGVRALDDTTIQFSLSAPASYFPAIMAMWVAKPVPPELVKAHRDDWTQSANIWTNGPYMMTGRVADQALRFERNPAWVHADEVQIEVVNARIIIDPATEYVLYKANELDAARVPIADLQQARQDPILGPQITRQTLPCTYYYGFTTTKPPFDDVRVRTAFSAAIDRLALIQTVLEYGGEMVATSFAPPGTAGAPPPGAAGLGYDPQLARTSLQEFLDEKGLADGAAFAGRYGIVLGFNTGESHRRIALAVQAMWADILGVQVRLEEKDWGDFLEITQSTTPVEETFHIFRMGWCADYPDENNWVRQVFHYQEGANRVRRQCVDRNCTVLAGPAAFDRLVVQAAEEINPGTRAELYALAENILAREQVVAAFIFHHGENVITKSWLSRDFPLMGGANWSDWVLDWAVKKAVQRG